MLMLLRHDIVLNDARVSNLADINTHEAKFLLGLIATCLPEEVQEGAARHELHHNVHWVLFGAYTNQSVFNMSKRNEHMCRAFTSL